MCACVCAEHAGKGGEGRAHRLEGGGVTDGRGRQQHEEWSALLKRLKQATVVEKLGKRRELVCEEGGEGCGRMGGNKPVSLSRYEERLRCRLLHPCPRVRACGACASVSRLPSPLFAPPLIPRFRIRFRPACSPRRPRAAVTPSDGLLAVLLTKHVPGFAPGPPAPSHPPSPTQTHARTQTNTHRHMGLPIFPPFSPTDAPSHLRLSLRLPVCVCVSPSSSFFSPFLF